MVPVYVPEETTEATKVEETVPMVDLVKRPAREPFPGSFREGDIDTEMESYRDRNGGW